MNCLHNRSKFSIQVEKIVPKGQHRIAAIWKEWKYGGEFGIVKSFAE